MDANSYKHTPNTEFKPVSELDETTAIKQIEELREALRYHNHRYYVENDPVIADRAYDALLSRLNDLEAEFDASAPTSPTQRVGGMPVDGFETVTHEHPILSLEHSAEMDDVRQFARRVSNGLGVSSPLEYVCEPKYDGVSLVLYYEDGDLRRAVTRGDGEEGDDVTVNVRTIPSIPLALPSDDSLVVRGEVYMPYDAFQSYNKRRIERGDDAFANPRNATAGTIRHQDPSEVADRPLRFRAFQVVDSDQDCQTRAAENEYLYDLGFPVPDRFRVVTGIEEAIAFRDAILDQRDEMDTPVDGVVIKVNDAVYQDQLGRTSHHPRWAFAAKFPSRSKTTKLHDIAVQVGRTGRLTPVALLDPVDVDGVTVSRATLHNEDQVHEMGVAPGDIVEVERAGDVIPQIAGVVESRSDSVFSLPDACPVCGSAVVTRRGLKRCSGGFACEAQKKRSIEYFVSRDGLDIDGVGEQVVEDFVDVGLIDDVGDLYELDVDDIVALDGYGETSAQKIVDEIQDTTTPRLDEVIAALGIASVGTTLARELGAEFADIEAFRTANVSRLTAVEKIGPETARDIVQFFESEANAQAVEHLLEHVSIQPYEPSDGGVFDDTTVVFTGSLPSYTRSEASEIVQEAGGRVTSSVSGATDVLVAGETPGQSKISDAEENGVEVVDGEEFESRLENAQ